MLLHKRPSKGLSKTELVSLCFLLSLALCVSLKKMSGEILVIYFVVSLATFVIYLKDKRAAEKGGWRVKESTLHLLALCGGWPGAIFAQNRFRHKTKKRGFQLVFWGMVFANCGVLYMGITFRDFAS